jgi:hypothetical protein
MVIFFNKLSHSLLSLSLTKIYAASSIVWGVVCVCVWCGGGRRGRVGKDRYCFVLYIPIDSQHEKA